jgi:hypothetical protein
MQLVCIFTEGDGCTYSCDTTIPIERESVEAAQLEFISAAETDDYYFSVFGHEFKSADWEKGKFLPTILTIDEWFREHSR